MAASIVTSVPIILAFTLLQRFFVQGLTAGAVKSWVGRRGFARQRRPHACGTTGLTERSYEPQP
ncbi:MAG: hypothetical protein P1P87_03090 [Trueperaceae bacterium]|nr:hypothetical protein [Trueperaceae bacterium]